MTPHLHTVTRFAILISIVLACACRGGVAQAETSDTLSVLSFNLHGLLVDGNSHDWDPDRAERLLHEIEALDPDLVGFQEVLQTASRRGSDNELKTLADSLTARTGTEWSYFVANTHASWDRYTEGIGILTKLPVFATGSKTYSNQSVFRRKLLWVRVSTRLGPIEFYTTHLAHQQQAENTRLKQVRELKSIIQSRRDSAFAAIVTGDFNAAPTSPPILAATTADSTGQLFDVYGIVNPGSPGYTMPSDNATTRIDYVFVRDTMEFIPETAGVVFSDRVAGKLLSDHLGVYAELILPVGVGIESDGPAADEAGSAVEIEVYPNPFMSTARVVYSLREPTTISLTVFDVTGRSVLRLSDERQSAGRHTAEISAAGLPAGAYLIAVDTGHGRTVTPVIHL